MISNTLDFFQQKIQSELTSHDISLDEMKKRNRGKDAAKRIFPQIDIAQVCDFFDSLNLLFKIYLQKKNQ